MSKGFLSLIKEFDEKGEVTIMLGLNTELIRGGILKELKPTQLKVLIALTSHMDSKGEAFPSMRYLSEITGITVATIHKIIKDLLSIRIQGKPILYREVEGEGAKKKSKYSFNIEMDFDREDIINEPKEKKKENTNKRMTAKELVIYFCEEFQKEFGYEYKVRWAIDTSQIKRMSKQYKTDEEVKQVIQVTIKEYKKRWSNPRFPAPTIGAMAGWLNVHVMQVIKNRENKVNRHSEVEETEEDIVL